MYLDPQFWYDQGKKRQYGKGMTKTVRDDVVFVTSAVPMAIRNLVSYTDTPPDNLPELIEEIKEHYTNLGNDFLWIVHPLDRPKGIADELIRQGFQHYISTHMAVVIPTPTYVQTTFGQFTSPFTFTEVNSEAIFADDFADLNVHCFPNLYANRQQYREVTQNRLTSVTEREAGRYYFAAYDQDTLVGFSSLTVVNEKSFLRGHLAIAGTHELFRSKGIYTGMIYHRVLKSLELELDVVTINANTQTSGPIIKKYRMTPVVTEDWYYYKLTT